MGVARTRKPGYHPDGDGLYLQVAPGGGKSWVFRYKIATRPREMGLGSLSAFTLAEARERAKEARKLLADRVDPIEYRKTALAAAAAANQRASTALTFEQAAEQYIRAFEGGWKNPKHIDQWRNTIATHATPIMGSVPIAEIDDALVLRVLEPIWRTTTETATRLRGRLEKILDWAKANKMRTGDNPAKWVGHLDKLLPDPSDIAPVVNHPSMPHTEIGAFMKELRALPGVSALALEFIILTASRTSEVLGAKWSEIDTSAAVWTVPAERMKAKKEHRVPLSKDALAVLKKAKALGGEYVFPGRKPNTPQSNMSCLALLRRIGRTDIVVHGFRSTFRVWAAERTDYPSEIAEAALAHTINDQTIAAYLRTSFFDRRRSLMQEWASYCARVPAPRKKASK